MKKILIILFATCLFVSCKSIQGKRGYAYSDVPFTNVHFSDFFWATRIETVRNTTVPFAFNKCEETGRIDNFAIAAGLKPGKFNTTYPFDDSDVFKIIEGASYLLAVKKDTKLDTYVDRLITLIGQAQDPDGYIYTNRTINNPLHPWAGKERWENERNNSHELYNLGHMYEAAVAHFQATGKRSFLDIAVKSANLLCETFGLEEGKLMVAPGHQEVEVGLVKLYRATGDLRYLELSKYFLDARGKCDTYDRSSEDQFQNGTYSQDHKAVIEQDEAVGHAVRAAYMYSAMADVAALKGDESYLKAVDVLWENVVGKKMYITGGIGSARRGEAFGHNYELPNNTAYCETCASIANCMWNLRMFMLHGESKYIDVLERSLYNGVLSGISLNGKQFFYPNVLSCDSLGSERSEWFSCSCCPSNLSRFIPSVPGYVYATSNKGIYINLYGANNADVILKDGQHVKLIQETEYPWNGTVKLTLHPERKTHFDIMLRIPGWASEAPVASDLYKYTEKTEGKVEIKINGETGQYKMEKGYAVLSRRWNKGDVIELSLPMEVRKCIAHEKVKTNVGKLSVERGPLVYCAEFADNKNAVLNLIVKPNTILTPVAAPQLFDGVCLLKGNTRRIKTENVCQEIKSVEDSITLIPYYARSHRGRGEMTVWFPIDENIVGKKLKEYGRMANQVQSIKTINP